MDVQTGKAHTNKRSILDRHGDLNGRRAHGAGMFSRRRARLCRSPTDLFNEVDFPWMMNDSQQFFSLGWMPETGFLAKRWSTYSELLILYVLGIGSLTHPTSSAAWEQWKVSLESDCGYTYMGRGPLFIHQ
jgi:hypothetical protein